MALNVIDRLNDKTIKCQETGCWLYTGSNDGYGRYGKARFGGVKVAVHRISAHLFLGLDLTDDRLRALHKPICPNKNCWNPDHLYVGTDRDNSRDMINAGVLFTRVKGVNKFTRRKKNRG